MKVLIADDEPVIVKGLKKLINWESYDLEIVGEASDGKKLWSLVQEIQPDIVISDICMPNMTGLEFMSELKQSKYPTKVIFISGYQKFSYVQEAIGLGALDYLLKPVQKNALVDALLRAKNELMNRKRLELFKEDKNELQQFFQKINEGSEFAKEDLYNSFAKLGIDYKGKEFCGICVYFTEESREHIENQMYEKFELMKFSMFNKVQNFFKHKKNGFIIKRESDCLNLLCVVAPEEKISFVADVILPMKQEIEQDMEVKLQIGVGEFSSNLMELNYVYKSARFAYEMSYFKQSQVICSSQVHKQFTHSFEEYDKIYQKVLEQILKREKNCIQSFEECLQLMIKLHYGNRYAVINRVILFAGNLYQDLKEYSILHEEDWSKQESFMELVRCQKSVSGLQKVFMEHYLNMIEQLGEQVKDWDNPVIREIKNYICEHYAENITMNQMAKIACVNAYYFSALFKKTSGQNFKNYLTDIRMKEAQKLVITTDYKTYEIGERVGYKNARQFTDKFREYYGASPSEYKKQLLEN